VLFGGIHDITWELDDLWVYEIKAGRWRMVCEDTTRRKEQDSHSLSPLKLADSNGGSSRVKKKVSVNWGMRKLKSLR
jgi:hypothetical protein